MLGDPSRGISLNSFWATIIIIILFSLRSLVLIITSNIFLILSDKHQCNPPVNTSRVLLIKYAASEALTLLQCGNSSFALTSQTVIKSKFLLVSCHLLFQVISFIVLKILSPFIVYQLASCFNRSWFPEYKWRIRIVVCTHLKCAPVCFLYCAIYIKYVSENWHFTILRHCLTYTAYNGWNCEAIIHTSAVYSWEGPI